MIVEKRLYPFGSNIEAMYPEATFLMLTTKDPSAIAFICGVTKSELYSLSLLLDGKSPYTICMIETDTEREAFEIGSLAKVALSKIDTALKQSKIVRNNFEGDLPTSLLTYE